MYSKLNQFENLKLFLLQDGLSDSDLKGLDEVFIKTYKKKYPVVGYMDYLIDAHIENTVEDRFTEEL